MATKTEKAKSELANKLQESVKTAEKAKNVKTAVKALSKQKVREADDKNAKVIPPTDKPATVRRQATFPDSWIIRLTEKGQINPKRRANGAGELTGAWELYECYEKGSKGITVGEYVRRAQGTKHRPTSGRSAIAWDLKRGWITVTEK
jgi:hypothetical protein